MAVKTEMDPPSPQERDREALLDALTAASATETKAPDETPLSDLIFTTASHDSTLDAAAMRDAFRAAMEKNLPPAVLKRLDQVVHFDPLTEQVLGKVAGKVMARKFGDKDLTREQEAALGEIALQIVKAEGYDKDKGARAMIEALETGMSKPLASDIEDALCTASTGFAARTNGKRADALAEGFKAGVDARPMKRLRLQQKNGFAAVPGTTVFNFHKGWS